MAGGYSQSLQTHMPRPKQTGAVATTAEAAGAMRFS